MTAAVDTDRLSELDAKIDRLSEQVAYLAEQAQEAAMRRQMQSELIADLSPIAAQAMNSMTRELATTDLDMAAVIRLLKRLAESVETLDAALEQLQAAHGLVEDIMPLTGNAFMTLTEQLSDLLGVDFG